MNTYILLAVLTYYNNATSTSVSAEFSSKQTCIAAAVKLRTEVEFTNNIKNTNGRIQALQCVKK